MATLLDPRFKSAGSSKRQNATVAKELLISELLDRHTQEQNIDIEEITATGATEEQDVAPAVATSASQEWSAILESESQSEDDGDELANVETRLRREVMR